MPHYSICDTIKSINDLREFFPTGKADDMNWCVFSTSGVHGSYSTLDDVEAGWLSPDYPDCNIMPYEGKLTVLVIQPRLVCLSYGNISVETKEDADWLRVLVNSTVDAILESQEGNFPKE